MEKSEERIGGALSRSVVQAGALRQRGGQPGNANAFKHGRYSASAMADRRRARELLREARMARRAALCEQDE